MAGTIETIAIAALAAAGVVARPWRLPEAIWALAGAAALAVAGLLPIREALTGVAKGMDVYLFLIGMMLLSETARLEGLFDWLAAHAAKAAKGSASRLFLTIYLVGAAVTVFLSNDATAVVLTPAVAAAARAAKAERPLPYLFVCAFIANAASFVLPISNPANLVIYGPRMPPLLEWLSRYWLASTLSIAATFAALRFSQRGALRQRIETDIAIPKLSAGGRTAGYGIACAAIALTAASAFDCPLGAPTCAAGLVTAAAVLFRARASPWNMIRGVSWGVLPLVAGLFMLVEGLNHAGVLRGLADGLKRAAGASETGAAWAAGVGVALAGNLMNNLPAGLIAGGAVQAAEVSPRVTAAVLIGVDLGPNLSVTGSLATILWLAALRREGQSVGAWAFLKLGAAVMIPALLLALAGLILAG